VKGVGLTGLDESSTYFYCNYGFAIGLGGATSPIFPGNLSFVSPTYYKLTVVFYTSDATFSEI